MGISALEDRTERIASEEEDEVKRLEGAERLALEEKEENERLALINLGALCTPLFGSRLSGYQEYVFNNGREAYVWLNIVTIVRTDKSKSYEERVPFQLRYAFLNYKINQADSPLMIAIGDINSINFDESSGLLCTNGGMVDISLSTKDNIVYPIVMQRKWV